MSDAISPLASFVLKLNSRYALGEADQSALLSLAHSCRTYEPAAYLVREGESPRLHCRMIVTGFAYRHKLLPNGDRQIVRILLPGDIVDLQQLVLERSDHNVQSLTRTSVLEIDSIGLRQLAFDRPAVGRAMWADGIREASIGYEHMVNIACRQARPRVAHLLCDFAVRMEIAGLATGDTYQLPITQEQIGDAVGLTGIHVNRTLKALVAEGLITYRKASLTILDRKRLREVAEFTSFYLHLDQGPGADF